MYIVTGMLGKLNCVHLNGNNKKSMLYMCLFLFYAMLTLVEFEFQSNGQLVMSANYTGIPNISSSSLL